MRTTTRKMSVIATAAVAALQVAAARGAVQTYSAASGFPGSGQDHPGFGWHPYDPGVWDTGLDAAPRFNNPVGSGGGEFAFTGSDGAFHMEVYTLLGTGVTGNSTDHAAHLIMNYNPNPPTTSFGTFWYGGIGNDVGPYPKQGGVPVAFSQVLMYADVIAPAGAPMEFRVESNYTSQGNGRKISFTGTGTWQTVGGPLSIATGYGSFDLNDAQISPLIAFGQNGNEITAIDDGSDPNNIPAVHVDNLTMTIAQASWTGTTGGTWSDNSKWNIIAPDGGNATAIFGNVGGAPQTITMDVDHFAGTLQFDNPNSYTLAGSGTLNLRAIGGGTFSSISVLNGSHTISAPTLFWGDTTVTAPAGSTLTVSNLQAAPVNLTKAGAGNLAVNNVRTTALTINAGTVTVITNGSDTGASKVTTLTIAGGPSAPTAALDLKDNDLVVSNFSYADTTTLISFARHSGAWDRPGITSSLATTAPHDKMLGVLTGAEYHALHGGTATFNNFSVANSDMLVKFTYYGDTDFNGKVDGADYARIDTTFNNETAQGNIGGWVNGDLDYNGKVDGADYALIDSAFNSQLGTLRPMLSFIDGTNPDRGAMNTAGLRLVLDHFDEFGDSYAAAVLANVPGPSTLPVLALGYVTLAKRRRA